MHCNQVYIPYIITVEMCHCDTDTPAWSHCIRDRLHTEITFRSV